MSDWVTPEEMRELLLEDDVDPDELPLERVEELLDELVEEGVWREEDGKYQVAGHHTGLDYLQENR